MKNILFTLALLISFVSFGQDLRGGTYSIDYLGNSTYTIRKEGGTGFISLKKLYKRGVKSINEWTNSLNANYKVINVDEVKTAYGVTPKVTITFKLLKKDGSEYLTKQDAIAKLKEAKDLVELDMMSSEEYDKLREELKPIIMNRTESQP